MAKKKPTAEVQTPAGVPAAPVAAPAAVPAPAGAPVAPAAPKAPRVTLVTQNGIARPQEGTKTARVWEISDELSAAAQKPARRKDVLEKAVAEGLNVATATTQYGRWRKFNGLKGTDEVAEAPAAPAAK